MLLHDQKTDENAIKSFFYEVYEMYVKVCLPFSFHFSASVSFMLANSSSTCLLFCVLKLCLNPFYEKNTAITSKPFDDKVRASAKKAFSL
jgi:hypothetical protein